METQKGEVYKLYYFPGNGRAMISRAILECSKANWEDVEVSPDEWKTMKKSGKCDYEQLPILEYKGKNYSQSHAIEFYLGKTFGLYGKNLEDEYQINSLLDSFDDLFLVFHTLLVPTEEEKKNKEKIHQDFLIKLEFFVEVYDKHYEKNGYQKYYLGDFFSVADIYVCCVLSYYGDLFKCYEMYEKKVPKLNNLVKEVKENELHSFFEKKYRAGKGY